MRNAYQRAQIIKKNGDANGLWDYNIIQLKGEERQKHKVIKVIDEALVKRIIKILNTSISIQDIILCKEIKELDVLHSTKKQEGRNL